MEWCRQALVDGDQAAGLWTRLLEIVSTVRTAGGTLTRARLAERLDGVELAVLPRYEADHRILADMSARNLDGVVESVAGGVHIRRNDPPWSDRRSSCRGPFPGARRTVRCRKTALARAWARGREVLWLNAEDLPTLVAPGAASALQHPLLEVLAAWPRPAWLIIDALDRAFAEPVLRWAAMVIRVLRDAPEVRFGVLVTAQQQEWPRVSDALADANAAVVWRQVPVSAMGRGESPPHLGDHPVRAVSRPRGGGTTA